MIGDTMCAQTNHLRLVQQMCFPDKAVFLLGCPSRHSQGKALILTRHGARQCASCAHPSIMPPGDWWAHSHADNAVMDMYGHVIGLHVAARTLTQIMNQSVPCRAACSACMPSHQPKQNTLDLRMSSAQRPCQCSLYGPSFNGSSPRNFA